MEVASESMVSLEDLVESDAEMIQCVTGIENTVDTSSKSPFPTVVPTITSENIEEGKEDQEAAVDALGIPVGIKLQN